jgi:iron complex outermembrane receptor protein
MDYIRTLLLTVAVVTYSVGCIAQCDGSFTGVVLDESNNPVVGAALLLSPIETGVVTDTTGAFSFHDLCPQEYTVKVQYLGLETLNFKIEIQGSVRRIIHLKEGTHTLAEVVIEDQMLHTEHANNVVRLGAKELAESAGKTLGESLKEVPGVNSIQTGPGIFKPVIHGVHSQRVLILNHGIRQEGQQWGAEHAPEIDPFIASDVAIIKDASSIKYGTDAIGGVIVVNPAPLPERPGVGGTLSTILQSNGRSGTISGMLEGGIKGLDGWGWRAQGTAKRTGDFKTSSYYLTNSGVQELNFSGSVGYHDEHKGFEVFYSHFNSDIGILKGTAIGNQNDLENAMEREEPLYTAGFSYDIGAPRQQVGHDLIKASGHFGLGNGELRVQYGFQSNVRKEFDLRIGDLSNVPALNLRLQSHSVEAEWETARDKWSICSGVTAMFQMNRKVFGTQRVPFIPDFNNTSVGVFSVGKIYFKRWELDLGARYDYRFYSVAGFDFKNALFHSNIHFNNLSATAGANIRLRENESVNLNISSAWRPPHVVELYSVGTHQSAAANEFGFLLNDSTNEVMDIDDVDFKTEQAVKMVGTYHRQWKKFSLEASPYANYILNYIYLRPWGITQTVRGTYATLRYAQTDALFLGADLSAVWQPHDMLKITSKASLIHASDQANNDYLMYIPSNWYEIAFRHERPLLGGFKNFYVESKTKYVSRQHRAPRVVTVREINEAREMGRDPFDDDNSNFDFMAAPKAYVLWNVALGASVQTDKMLYDFKIGAENILNTSYREYTNRFRYYADDLGRNFIISMKCTF